MAKDNIIDYVNTYNRVPLTSSPINEKDGLVFALISYLFLERLDIFTDDKVYITLSQLEDYYEEINKGSTCVFANKKFVPALSHSPRFKDIEIRHLDHKYEPENYIQYFACTFVDEASKTVCITFRGTTSDLCGWVEDIELATLKVMPADKLASAYASRMIKQYNGYTIYIAGHSKGGNMAAYCLYSLTKEELEGVTTIFDFDGPNFDIELDPVVDPSIVKKFVPRDCVVGNLLEHGLPYKVIDSYSVGPLQHNAFNWKIENGDFVYLDSVSPLSSKLRELLDETFAELNQIDKETVVKEVKAFCEHIEGESYFEILRHPVDAAKRISEACKLGKESQTKGLFKTLLLILKQEKEANKKYTAN